jgi:recombinational DNA repair protein (RecF pathway)
LFSISQITYLPGRGELGTLISTRLQTYYSNIVKDIERTMLGYELLKRVNRITEDAAGEEYFTLLQKTIAGLDDLRLEANLTELWFIMQLLHVSGHAPNLKNDIDGNKLEAGKRYLFDFDRMAFGEQEGGPYGANHIKLLRLAHATEDPLVLKQVRDSDACAPDALQLAKNLLSRQVNV